MEKEHKEKEIEYRAGIYLRLSREDEEDKDESNSITNQRMIVRDWAKVNKIPVVNEYEYTILSKPRLIEVGIS